MKPIKQLTLAIAIAALSTAAGHAQLTLNFSSSPGATIQFNGSQQSLQFNASTFGGLGGVYSGTQWFVGSENGGTGSAVGLFGSVANGPFNYGHVTVSGNEESATISGPSGNLVVNDGSGNNLTGNIDWIQVQTFDYSGALNASLVVNVTGLSYGGNNPDLKTLVASGVGAMNLSFQFAPGETLSQLSTGSSPFTTSFSGSITAVPEPATTGLVLLGFTALILPRFLRKTVLRTESQPLSGRMQSN